MQKKLTDIATGELLEKFGAGGHKPGSGSASAFQGMLAAQLLRTVIELTNEDKRKPVYDRFIPELNRIRKEIDERIYIELTALFQKDAELFDKVIQLREERNKEKNFQKKRQIAESATNALKLATQTPIDIAQLCIELGDFAAYVFDTGFRSARGDAGVALNSAISGIAGCLSIVDLNLISLPFDDVTERLRSKKAIIKLNLDRLWSISIDRLKVLELESSEARQFNQKMAEFQAGNLAEGVTSNADIEKIVKKLQNVVWTERTKIWKDKVIEFPAEVLQPNMVLRKVMGYSYEEVDQIGTYRQGGEIFEIAGLIDKKKKHVAISKNFPQETISFTAAHELGHAILHRGVVLHRDKPMDGSNMPPRSKQELQADKFAAYFLLPENIVK
jgi:formiminotetrahydrofolate cyclodeaminase